MKTFLPSTPQHQLLFESNVVIDDVDYVPERENLRMDNIKIKKNFQVVTLQKIEEDGMIDPHLNLNVTSGDFWPELNSTYIFLQVPEYPSVSSSYIASHHFLCSEDRNHQRYIPLLHLPTFLSNPNNLSCKT
jgi:hypothetical protein